jgi:hypothetical protein
MVGNRVRLPTRHWTGFTRSWLSRLSPKLHEELPDGLPRDRQAEVPEPFRSGLPVALQMPAQRRHDGQSTGEDILYRLC